MIIFPHGAIIAACSAIKNNEKKSSTPKEKTKITSEFTISVNDDNTANISFNVINDSDWAMAAWALINACKENGQEENLSKMLKNKEIAFYNTD